MAEPRTESRRQRNCAFTIQPGCAATNSCYPASNFITAANTGGNTNYNSLQVSAEQRVRYGLTMLFNYTWSKALDNMPWNQAATSIGAGNSFVYPITVPNFKALDYGPTEFDHRNVIAASYVYTEPKFMNDAPAALRYLVNGYETTGPRPVPHRRPADHYFQLKQQLRFAPESRSRRV